MGCRRPRIEIMRASIAAAVFILRRLSSRGGNPLLKSLNAFSDSHPSSGRRKAQCEKRGEGVHPPPPTHNLACSLLSSPPKQSFTSKGVIPMYPEVFFWRRRMIPIIPTYAGVPGFPPPMGMHQKPYTVIPTLLGSDFGVLGHLWSQNDVVIEWLRLIATSNSFPHPHETLQSV